MSSSIISQPELKSLTHSLAAHYAKQPKRTDDGWQTHCPLHDDQTGSLCLSLKDDKLLVCCHAGCDQDKVWSSVKAMLPNQSKGGSGKANSVINAVYQYQYADGTLAMEKERRLPKGFLLRRPDGHGGYIYKNATTGMDTSILYRLPQVLQAIRDGEIIYIAEGEKDCDNLSALGLCATCNLFGASQDNKRPKWTDKNTAWLKGVREAIIFPDNDDAGQAHAQAIANSLNKIGTACKIVELPGLPPKGDVSDWLVAGGTKTELLELAEHARLWKPIAHSREDDVTSEQQSQEREKQADKVVRLTVSRGCELFHDRNGTAYGTVPVNEHLETWKIHSLGFKRWLRNAWYKDFKKGLSAQILSDALDTLDAKANCEGDERQIYIRLAHIKEEIYIDLCDADWRVAHVTATGWSIIDKAPIHFCRTPGQLPLPVPTQGGVAANKINKLRPFINAADDENWRLILAWILGAFSPGPYPVLAVLGEWASAKSFLCKVCRDCVDPSEVSLGSIPREMRDVIIACQNSHVYGIDNLSKIPDWLSDLLCSISTGSAHRERKYHTNNGDEVLFKARCPIIMNGIDLTMRGDLLSRALLVTLKRIDDQDRKEEAELDPQIRSAMPEILGGILDVLVAILKHLPATKLKNKPRMADFAKWVTAGEGALGWNPGAFMQTYDSNRHQAVELAIESDSFGAALRDFMVDRPLWSGGWKELIRDMAGDDPPKGWPHSGKALCTKLTRLAPALRHVGVFWRKNDTDKKRGYEIEKKEGTKVSDPSYPSGDNAGNTFKPDRSENTSASHYGSNVSNDGSNLPMTDLKIKVSGPQSIQAEASDTYDSSDASIASLCEREEICTDGAEREVTRI